MFIIGITGGIGSGKSTVAELCRRAGFTVLDADGISREVTMAGGAALPPQPAKKLSVSASASMKCIPNTSA